MASKLKHDFPIIIKQCLVAFCSTVVNKTSRHIHYVAKALDRTFDVPYSDVVAAFSVCDVLYQCNRPDPKYIPRTHPENLVF